MDLKEKKQFYSYIAENIELEGFSVSIFLVFAIIVLISKMFPVNNVAITAIIALVSTVIMALLLKKIQNIFYEICNFIDYSEYGKGIYKFAEDYRIGREKEAFFGDICFSFLIGFVYCLIHYVLIFFTNKIFLSVFNIF